MKALNVTIRNFKRITNAEITIPYGKKLIKITGENGSGKSSFIEALKSLTGGGKVRLARPIHDDAEEAEIIGEFGNDKVEMTATLLCRRGQSDKLTIVPLRAGYTPQALMDYLTGGKAFDPLEFSTMGKDKQFETLLRLVPLKDSKGKPLDLKQIAFLNTQDYNARKVLNASVRKLDAQHAAIACPPGTPDKEVDVSQLLLQLSDAAKLNTEIAVTQQRRTDAITRAERNAAIAVRKQEELRAALAQAEADQKRFEDEAKGLKAEKDKKPIDTTELQKKIDKASETNKAVAAKRRRLELTAESKKLDKEADALTAAMQLRDAEKIMALESAKFPVKGLTFGEEEVLFNGYPFDQISQALQIMVSVKIGMALNSEMKIMYSRFGGLLDKKRWAELEKVINESKWDGQLFIEEPDATDQVGIVMSDGHVQEVIP